MDNNLRKVKDLRLERTVKALIQNQFDARIIRNREELIETIKELIPQGGSCSIGGAMTLFETGVVDLLKTGGYEYFDRYEEGVDVPGVFAKALACDVYLCSSNAITEDGKLYNVDGRGNRVAAMIYGPGKVIVVAGENKIVKDLEEARDRNKNIAAPANAVRLGCKTPCAVTGKCEDCSSPGRICSFEVVHAHQLVKDRITVLLMPEDLGY